MRYLLVLFVFLFSSPCLAWESPCHSGPVPPKPFPRETRSTYTLEARRVISVQGNLILYDLGGETVVIKAEGLAPLSFVSEVQKGRCTAREAVTIEPDRKNLAEGRFKARTPAVR